MPLDCEKNILEVPVSASIPANTDVVIFTLADGTSVIRTWATILGGITPNSIQLFVDGGGSNPVAGDPSYTNTALIGKRVTVSRQGLEQPTQDPGGGYYYSFDNSTGTITPSPAFQAGEYWIIKVY